MLPTNIDPRIVAQFNARAPFRMEEGQLVVLARVGSHSHGTYMPPTDPEAIDDVDYMGVILPPASYVIGIDHWKGTVTFQHEELDVVIYSFQKFIGLLLKANPNVLGMLWQDATMVLHTTDTWQRLVHHRHLFASLCAYDSFIGYAKSQFDKMTAFDVTVNMAWEQACAVVRAAGWAVDQVKEKTATLPMPDYAALCAFFAVDPELDLIFAGDLERAKTAIQRIHARHFQGYMGEKRKTLVMRFGFDTKNAAHLIRLMRMCVEFLRTGRLTVLRTTDADELRAIKRGDWTLTQVQAEAQRLFTLADLERTQSFLPAQPLREPINQLIMRLNTAAYLDRVG